ncbi:hypothetical protein AZA_54631 [Nitrospirillum viridazoti Y2]|nr:hypothetical protein AZA_54631 [Nitrospirillum amazonense Y2]
MIAAKIRQHRLHGYWLSPKTSALAQKSSSSFFRRRTKRHLCPLGEHRWRSPPHRDRVTALREPIASAEGWNHAD